MYSVMLAAMLTTTSATPEWGCHGCYSCHGCSGYSFCHGCYGCYGGWSCYGVALPHHGYWTGTPAGVMAPENVSPKAEETPLPKEEMPKMPKNKIEELLPAFRFIQIQAFDVGLEAAVRVHVVGILREGGLDEAVLLRPIFRILRE